MGGQVSPQMRKRFAMVKKESSESLNGSIRSNGSGSTDNLLNNPLSSSRSRLTSRDWTTGADMGAIFGLDAGGTLAKLVYFEKV